MKTTRYILAALLPCIFAACTSEPAPTTDKLVFELTASIAADGPQTRTVLIDNPGVRVETYWTPGDAISIFTPSGENRILYVDYDNIGDNGKTAIFHTYEGFPSGSLSALYPADENANVSSGKINTIFPDTQHYVLYEGRPQPDPAVSLMAGTGTASAGIAFKNVMSVLKIGQSFLNAATVTAVTFRDLSGAAVAGSLSINPSDNYASGVSGGNTVLTLDCGEGVELEPGATGVFYLVVPARTYPKGIQLSFITSEGEPVVLEVGTDKGLTLGRGIIYPVGEISARDYIAGEDASVLADNAHLMTSDIMRQVTVLDVRTEYVINADGDYVYYGDERMTAPCYSLLIPNDMPFKEGDYLVFDATDDLPSGGVFLITKKETPYADEKHSRIEAHLTTDFAKAFKKLDYGEQLYDADGNMIEGAGENMDLASYLSDVVDYQGNSIPYSITKDGQIIISEEDFEEALSKAAVLKTDKSISSPKLSMTVTDPNKVCEATVGAKLTINMKAAVKVEDGELQWLHFNFNPQVKVSGNFSIKGALSRSKEFHLITLYFVPGIPVAPGVVLTPELEIKGSVGVGGEVVFSTSIEYTYDMGNFGFSYNSQGFHFHHFESEPKPDEKFQPELGASLTGTLYAQATLSAIPSLSLCGIFRAGIYTDFSLKFAATTGGETINNNIYDTRKLSLVPELAFSPYVASLGGVFSSKWENLVPKIEFDPLWERYLDPVMDYKTTIDVYGSYVDETSYVASSGGSYYFMQLKTQDYFDALFTVGTIWKSLDGFSYTCKSLKPTLDDWEVCVLVMNGDFNTDWKSQLVRYNLYLDNKFYDYPGLFEQNRYQLMDIPNNQDENDDISASGEISCPGDFLPGDPRVLRLVCVNKRNQMIYPLKESNPITYYWPQTPDGPWWSFQEIDYATFKSYKDSGFHVWPSDIPLPF